LVSGSQDIDGWREDGMVGVHGHVDARFGPVRECFTEVIDGQPGTGAAFAAWCDGWLVADLWGGAADLGGRPWEAGSLVQPYSVSKPFVAVCALRLVEAGGLDLDAPVQRYWPEFRAPATVRHVLSHQAGVVAGQEPSWEIPAINGHGTARAVAGFYHALASHRLLGPGMLAEAISPQCAGPDGVFGDDNAWGLGFGISDDGYGMGGMGGSYGGTCTAGGYTIGFVTDSAGSFDRIDALEAVLRDCLGLPRRTEAG
jgi:Beta-lactamase